MEVEISESEALHLVMAVKEMCYACDDYSSDWSGCEKCEWGLLKKKFSQCHIKLYTERKKLESK